MITKEEVKKVAKLARLGLTQKEIEKMQKDLSLILDYFNLLKAIDISGVESTSQVSRSEIFCRKDEARKESPEESDKLINAVPEKENRYIRVKEIL